MLAASLVQADNNTTIQYGPEGNLIVPHAIVRRFAEQQKQAQASIYDENGRVKLPEHLSTAHPDDFTHDHHGRVLSKRQAANGGGGITYNSEGGIVLPNKASFAAAPAQQAGGSGVTYNSEGGIVLPNRLAFAATPAQQGGGISYNSEGGIVLPNRLAFAANSNNQGSGGGLSGDTVPMPYTKNKMAAGGSSGSSGGDLSGDTVPMPYTKNKMAAGDSTGGSSGGDLSGDTVPMPYTKNKMAAGDSSGGSGSGDLSGDTVPMPYTKNKMAAGDSTGGSSGGELSGDTVPMPYTKNKMAAGDSTGGSGGGDLSGETVPMPYTKNKMAANEQKQGGITYNSEGGIVLPNSMATSNMQFAAANTQDDSQYHKGAGSFYDAQAHVGVCGKRVKNTDPVAALNVNQMGTNSGKMKEKCGKKVEVVGPKGDKVEAEIVDLCNTCNEGDIDMSPAAFEKIAQFTSMKTDVKWKFTS
ncbi:hypothetical protein O0I10_001934 [Lichtheimia ornata]|uniref:RlpA-like protein double-psi beta-barrel domain-containing protein n=1 Tax=Lichtheimia ornata TaxID=688661 RepID=A0AAD7Y1Z3_9FUNG|nr:uncharacterized protein O0I10_001934 [Lichtheimia ornata]KAJ8662241.1 hypothetical protein O0I10_001934 [Lichtheimia ornata]